MWEDSSFPIQEFPALYRSTPKTQSIEHLLTARTPVGSWGWPLTFKWDWDELRPEAKPRPFWSQDPCWALDGWAGSGEMRLSSHAPHCDEGSVWTRHSVTHTCPTNADGCLDSWVLLFGEPGHPERNMAVSDVWDETGLVSLATSSFIVSQQGRLKDSSLCI